MNKNEIIDDLIIKWVNIADRDLMAAEQGLKVYPVLSEIVCFHCQQAAEKYLKAYLVKHQVEFQKTHSIMSLINICSTVDSEFKDKLLYADLLTDYAVEIRYPDEWYEPTIEEAKDAYRVACEVKQFVLDLIHMDKLEFSSQGE